MAVFAWKQGLFGEAARVIVFGSVGELNQLKEDAADTPHVHRLVVLLLDQDDFGRSIPAGADVAGDAPLLVAPALDVNQ
jgi:hypothetical protein